MLCEEPRYIVGVAAIPGDPDGLHTVLTERLTPGDVLLVDEHPETGEIVLQRI